MKSYFILLPLLHLIYSMTFRENHEMVISRLNWNKNHTQLITKGKVDFEWSEDKGTHCIAREDLYRKKFTFYIPKQYVTCACIYY
jgi:hypothetical protein